MVLNPTPEEEINESVESRLRGRISKLTNFVSSSFNKLFLDAFSEQLYEYEVRLLAAQLSGWVDYAGGPITQEDLDQLGLREFDDLELLNEFMEDEQLDNIGALVGVDRDLGEPATGIVRIDVFDDDTPVPDGMRVSTPPDIDGTRLTYEVDLGDADNVTPNDQGNSGFVEVDVIATENGSNYNVGAERVTRLSSPPPGVESVNNAQPIEGGEDPETNDEFRVRIKNAVFETSGGGTTEGIKGYIIGNVEGVNDVFVDEFLDATPVYVDVVVDGGTTPDVDDAIETSRPAGIRHNLVRPVTYNMAVEVELRGTDIDVVNVKNEIEEYVFDLDLGDDFIRDRVIQRAMNIDPDVENVLAINVRISEIVNYRDQYQTGTDIYSLADAPLGHIDDESHFYTDTKDVYRLGREPVDASTVTVEATVNGSTTTLTQGVDYDVVDNDGDGMDDSIDFSVGGDNPDDETVWDITYDLVTSSSETITYQNGTDVYPLAFTPALAGDSSVSDANSNTYTLGTDYDIVDNDGDGIKESIDWSIGGSSPADGVDFTVDYEVNVGSIYEVTGVLNDTEGHEFVEGTDFNELDNDSDGYADSIDWSVGGDSPDDQTDFSIDATIETDVIEDYRITDREKITPVIDEVEVITYE